MNKSMSPIKRFIARRPCLSILFYRDHAPGQTYIHRGHIHCKNPFKKHTPHIVEIIEIKKGWVNFKHTAQGSVFLNESMKRDSFNFTFQIVGA